ncbi:hypothetical protein HY772_09490 [Candidatus Woesearchaeota archaeon]|nr:hypothetical protein [Candidatus Woesearchaeota archaeon]
MSPRGCLSNLFIVSARRTTDEERVEFYHVSYKMREVLTAAFGPQSFDYVFPSTKEAHAHMLVLPRYAQRTSFNGVAFEDPQYGKHYDPYREVVLSNEVYTKLIEKIKAVAEPSLDKARSRKDS